MKNKRTINAFEVYFRRDGEKRSVLRSTKEEVNRYIEQLKCNRRKYLGHREVELMEVSNASR